MNPNELFIRNPHSILQTLKNRPKDILEISLPRDKKDDVWEAIENLVQKNKVRMSSGIAPSSGRSSSRSGPKVDPQQGGRESGHGAKIKAKPQASLEQLFAGITESSRGVWLALDCLQDPQNVGAIFRSAAFFGVKGIIATSEPLA